MSPKDNKETDQDWLKHWRIWAGWASWGSPVGLGIFLVCLGLMVFLLSATSLF